MGVEAVFDWLRLMDQYAAARMLPIRDTADLISHYPQDWYLKEHEPGREILTGWKNFCDKAYEGRAIVSRLISEGVPNPDLEAIHSFLLASQILASVSPSERDRVLGSARHLFSVASGQEQGSISAEDVSDTRILVGLFEKAMMGQSPLLTP
jgi:hypothetical protein